MVPPKPGAAATAFDAAHGERDEIRPARLDDGCLVHAVSVSIPNATALVRRVAGAVDRFKGLAEFSGERVGGRDGARPCSELTYGTMEYSLGVMLPDGCELLVDV
jgi:hypothetical protein